MKANTALTKWALDHIDELVSGDDGSPLSVLFTGTVERHHPNGTLAESLVVKKGKANGAYKEFFEDGSIRQMEFYKGGEISGDYWPVGTIKKKESGRGDQKLIEWFYPSGKLQKRIVLAKDGAHAEPVRLYYESGQLAEELSMRKTKKHGPWLKFFEDGTPQLQAEYAGDYTPIVHNAWDANRRQVVKDGTGVFDDDGRGIDPTYSLFFTSTWRRVSELSNGMPHGTNYLQQGRSLERGQLCEWQA